MTRIILKFLFSTRAGRAVKRALMACVVGSSRLFCFLPVREGRVLLTAYDGEQYSGSVKCVSEYLRDHWGQELELVWGFRQPERFQHVPGIKTVRYFSLKWHYYVLTSGVIVTNTGRMRLHPKRKEQFILNTWHGGGAYKRVGLSLAHLDKAEIRSKQKAVNKIDLFLSSSRFFSRFALDEDMGYRGEILPSGMPRNDVFFSPERREHTAQEVRKKLGLTGHVVLYAPTYRGDSFQNCRIDLHFPYAGVLRALRERMDGPVTMLKRAHYGGTMADSSPEEVMDVSDWPDMQELLCAADILITDYSSSMWDFALLGRPCLLYEPDLAEYRREQGLCTPVDQWPGIVCESEEALLDAIRTLDGKACEAKAREHLRAFGSYETGTATRQACERIMAHIHGERAGA